MATNKTPLRFKLYDKIKIPLRMMDKLIWIVVALIVILLVVGIALQ